MSRRASGLLAVVIGLCLVLGAAGVAVVQPASSSHDIALETSPGPAPTTAPADAAPEPSTTLAPTTSAAPPATHAPTPTAPKRTTTTRATSAPAPRAPAPGVTFTAPVIPTTPSAPVASPVPPAAAGDSISTAPLLPGTTTTTAAGAKSYAFLDTSADGSPARWNPCTPLHYVVNTTGAPTGALALVQQAAARVASATGMTLTFDGTTSEVPTSSWGFGPSASYPKGWQPLLIGFPKPGQSDLVDGDNAGAAFPVTVEFTASGQLVDVSGAVAIDGDLANALPMTFGGGSVGSIILHEMAHAVGLAHVNDKGEIMNPVVGSWTPNTWGPGDTEGLRQVGRAAGCTRTVPAPLWG